MFITGSAEASRVRRREAGTKECPTTRVGTVAYFICIKPTGRTGTWDVEEQLLDTEARDMASRHDGIPLEPQDFSPKPYLPGLITGLL